MTGKDLILYILQNDLENAPVFNDGRFLNFMTVQEAAVHYKTGEATVRAWIQLGQLNYIQIGNMIFIARED